MQDFLCELVTPGDVSNYDKIQVFASGFCPVALVTGQGFVLPGNLQHLENNNHNDWSMYFITFMIILFVCKPNVWENYILVYSW